MKKRVSKQEIKNAIDGLIAIADAIKEAKSIPSGTLYAVLMNFMSLNQFEQAIALLVKSGIIENKSNLLTWKINGETNES